MSQAATTTFEFPSIGMFTLGLQCFSIMKPVSSRSLRPQKNCFRARYWFFKIQCIASSYCLFSLTAESSWTSTYVIPPPPLMYEYVRHTPPPLMRSPKAHLWMCLPLGSPLDQLSYILLGMKVLRPLLQLVGFYGLCWCLNEWKEQGNM